MLTTNIHLVFYVILLKKRLEIVTIESCKVRVRHMKILECEIINKIYKTVATRLIRWSNLSTEHESWEDFKEFQLRFSKFDIYSRGHG